MARKKRAAASGGAKSTGPSPQGASDDAASTPTELSANEILEKRYAGKESEAAPAVAEHREKATELQFFWSCVAVGLIVVIAVMLAVVVHKWFGLEREFQTQLIDGGKDAAADASARVETYKDVSQLTFDRVWRIVDRVILGGLMSLLTLIIGDVFGARRPKTKD